MPNVAAGGAKWGRSVSDVAVIVPVMTIVGDSDEERHNERELVRASMSFYGSTPNYAFIWDEAGFEGTTARIREKQKAGDFKGMAAQITDEHIATFAIESRAQRGDARGTYGIEGAELMRRVDPKPGIAVEQKSQGRLRFRRRSVVTRPRRARSHPVQAPEPPMGGERRRDRQ